MPDSDATALPDRLAIEPMTEALLEQVDAIERGSFPDPWPQRFFIEELTRSDPAYARVAIEDGQVIGYLVAWFVLDEVHLGNLAVHPEHRRRGVGRSLLRHLIERAERGGASFISLEVRAGNRAAMSLYARHHFRPEGLRKGYYAGREDAVIMVRECGGCRAGGPGDPPVASPDGPPPASSPARSSSGPSASSPARPRAAAPAMPGGRPSRGSGKESRES